MNKKRLAVKFIKILHYRRKNYKKRQKHNTKKIKQIDKTIFIKNRILLNILKLAREREMLIMVQIKKNIHVDLSKMLQS